MSKESYSTVVDLYSDLQIYILSRKMYRGLEAVYF